MGRTLVFVPWSVFVGPAWSPCPSPRSLLTGNVSGDHCGGFFVTDGSGDLMGNRVTGNTCGNDGGGGYITLHYGDLIRNTFDGNEAADDAGGLRVRFGDVDIIDNEFTSNTAADAGGGINLSGIRRTKRPRGVNAGTRVYRQPASQAG